MEIQHFTKASSGFPDYLRHIPNPPESLYVLGNTSALVDYPRLAVVGTRKMTSYGRSVTNQLAGEAAGQGVVIISGLALGVDAIAHQAALDASGMTVAVLAGGLDHITPTTNYRLAMRILEEGGAIVSEYPPGTPPMKNNFIARNRLVSGLADGLLVTEAAVNSGTLHTVNFALDQGKTVMAVPGNINSPLSAGTNNLLRQGAVPVTTAKDIMEALNIEPPEPHQIDLFANDPAEATILKLLQGGSSTTGELLINSKLGARTFNQALTMLEITGRIHSVGAGRWGFK